MPDIDLLLTGFTMGTNQGSISLSTVTLIRGKKNILVDVGHFGRRQLLLQRLDQKSLSPEDINTVVITHAHWDHSQNIDLFPNAEFVINLAEIEYARHPRKSDFATARYFHKTLEGLNVREIQGGTLLEPGIKIIDTPGHTKGHISVVVETDSGSVVIAADALSDMGAVKRGTPYLIFWNEDEARSSIQKILSEGQVFYPGHDRPFRLNSDGSTNYVGGDDHIKFFGQLENDGSTIGVALTLETPRTTEIMPEAF